LFADPFDQTQSPIVYQQYFVPYSTFLASLPLLSTYFPVLPLASASTSGSGPGVEKDNVGGTLGYEDDIGWLSEFGIDPDSPVGGVTEEKTVSPEKELKGLLEGLVVGLEVSSVFGIVISDLLAQTHRASGHHLVRCLMPMSRIRSVPQYL
jgi:hypothetical protein